MKTKFAAIITGIGGLCVLCCVVPIAGFLGLGALEAFFCDSPWAIGMGAGLMTVGFSFLGYRLWKGFCAKTSVVQSCAIGCGCK
jgi:hypothetical protein